MEDKYNLKELVMYVVIIMAVLLIFYGITMLITNRQNNEVADTENDAIIDYDTILVQDLYNQSETSYYVFAYIEEENTSSYNSLIETYSNLEDSLRVYMIELESAFNKKYLGEQSNFEGTKPVFKGTTLLKIENRKIVEYYEDEDIDTILNILVGEE